MSSKRYSKEDVADEVTKVVANTANKLDIINISSIIPIEKFSLLQRLLVVTYYVSRFINNIEKSKKKLAGTISFEEKDNALNMWIQSEQKYIIFSEKFKQQCKSLQLKTVYTMFEVDLIMKKCYLIVFIQFSYHSHYLQI